MIYLDNAATTFPKPESVYKAMDNVNRTGAVNAGRGSYKLAKEASKLIQETKQMIRELIHVDISASVVFSPSVTVAMNQIINGLNMREGAVVYLSPYEHNAVARTVYHLSKTKKIKVKEVPIDEDSLKIDLEKLKYEFTKDKPDAIFCTHISNVTGYVLPVEEIFKEAKRYNCITIMDSAQSLGLIEILANQMNVDIIAFAGHKTLYGPFGIGGFVNVTGVPLEVFITGGTGSDSLNLHMPDSSEGKFEAASSNIVSIAGLNVALKDLNQNEILKHEKELTKYLIDRLQEVKEVEICANYGFDQQVGIVSIISKKMNSEDIGTILDEDFDIAVRTGYHCAPLIHKYLKDEKYLGTIRIGLSQFNSTKDIDELIDALKELEDE